MQDIHTLGGVGGGRIFSGGGVSGLDRRLQPQNHQNHQPLKCPRCDSQNTKFCYYNNYNLSQPRHFCKNCRRYWTEGGVLRNVPVGGGCRKSKRSPKAKSSVGNSSSNSQTATDSKKNDQSENYSHSGSESSSLTTTTATTKTNVVVGAGTAGTASSGENNDGFDHYQGLVDKNRGTGSDTNIEQMGTTLPIANMESSSSDRGFLCQNEPEKMVVSKGFIEQDHEVQVDPTALDWGNVETLGDPDVIIDRTIDINVSGGGCGGGGGEHGLFDLAGVDEAYWNQAQWVDDHDQSFNFLPQFQVLDFNLEKK